MTSSRRTSGRSQSPAYVLPIENGRTRETVLQFEYFWVGLEGIRVIALGAHRGREHSHSRSRVL